MTRAGAVLAAAVLAAAVLAPSASAAFTTPVELATAPYGLGVVADADGAGTTTALVSGAGHGPRLLERPLGGAWSAPAALPGNPTGARGPVLDAAGNGALGIAWRVDQPRRYSGIAVAMRDPGGTLGDPVDIAADDAGGVRHPAIAIDPSGDALLAYNSDTRKTHLSLSGAIAIAYRRSAGSFSTPTVVDRTPSSAPAVAIGADGAGVIAWTHGRRVYVVTVDANGDIGKVKAFASPDGVSGLVAAAGADGAATAAWVSHHVTPGRTDVHALGRAAGHAFAAARIVASTTHFVRDVHIAADEDARVTLAWGREHFDETRSGSRLKTSIVATSARAGEPFPAPRVVVTRQGPDVTTPVVAGADGRAVLAWGFEASRRDFGVQAAIGPARAGGPVQPVAHWTLPSGYFANTPTVAASIVPDGTATVFYVEAVAGANRTVTQRLLAVDGR